MSVIKEHLPVTNIEVDSHWLIGKSHLKYLNFKGPSSEAVQAVIRWLGGDWSIDQLREQFVDKRHRVRTFRSILAQVIFILGIGAAIFPIALLGFWHGFIELIKFVDNSIQTHSLPAEAYLFLDGVTRHIEGMTIHFERGELQVIGLIESLFLVAGALFILGIIKRFLFGEIGHIFRAIWPWRAATTGAASSEITLGRRLVYSLFTLLSVVLLVVIGIWPPPNRPAGGVENVQGETVRKAIILAIKHG
jgi:hypothetical protein